VDNLERAPLQSIPLQNTNNFEIPGLGPLAESCRRSKASAESLYDWLNLLHLGDSIFLVVDICYLLAYNQRAKGCKVGGSW
jgi:hypothetical protein